MRGLLLLSRSVAALFLHTSAADYRVRNFRLLKKSAPPQHPRFEFCYFSVFCLCTLSIFFANFLDSFTFLSFPFFLSILFRDLSHFSIVSCSKAVGKKPSKSWFRIQRIFFVFSVCFAFAFWISDFVVADFAFLSSSSFFLLLSHNSTDPKLGKVGIRGIKPLHPSGGIKRTIDIKVEISMWFRRTMKVWGRPEKRVTRQELQ